MTQELVSLTIIMAVAAVSPIVAQLIPGRFIPQTVLLLVTGAALGPYGLGVIEVNDAVKLLSELGMAFLFLLAGYEIDRNDSPDIKAKSALSHGSSPWGSPDSS